MVADAAVAAAVAVAAAEAVAADVAAAEAVAVAVAEAVAVAVATVVHDIHVETRTSAESVSYIESDVATAVLHSSMAADWL